MATPPEHAPPPPGTAAGGLPPGSPRTPPARPGLRQRKKARTRAAIREQALRLFREQGYDATTVEQIADAADISPSTFFRYFPTKEDVVLQDDMDLRWAQSLRSQPADMPPLAALRQAVRDVFAATSPGELEQLRQSAAMTMEIPAVRARSLDEFGRTVQTLTAMVAERAGRDADDFAVRTLAGAVLGVALTSWFAAAGDLARFADNFEASLALLESGLQL